MTLQRLAFSPSSSPGPVRKVIMSGSLGTAEHVLSRPWKPPEGWCKSYKWLEVSPFPGRAGEVRTHLGIMEVLTTRLWLVLPALLAVNKIDFLMYFSCAPSDFLWSNLPPCSVPVHEWIVFGAGFQATESASSWHPALNVPWLCSLPRRCTRLSTHFIGLELLKVKDIIAEGSFKKKKKQPNKQHSVRIAGGYFL